MIIIFVKNVESLLYIGYYVMNELRTPVIITKLPHKPATVKIRFFDFSHCPGDARVTGMPITKIVEITINNSTRN